MSPTHRDSENTNYVTEAENGSGNQEISLDVDDVVNIEDINVDVDVDIDVNVNVEEQYVDNVLNLENKHKNNNDDDNNNNNINGKKDPKKLLKIKKQLDQERQRNQNIEVDTSKAKDPKSEDNSINEEVNEILKSHKPSPKIGNNLMQTVNSQSQNSNNHQRFNKKRNYSAIEDEEMSRLEFQQWTSGFLADDLVDEGNGVNDVNVNVDMDVDYTFPQTTAEHFAGVVEDENESLRRKKVKRDDDLNHKNGIAIHNMNDGFNTLKPTNSKDRTVSNNNVNDGATKLGHDHEHERKNEEKDKHGQKNAQESRDANENEQEDENENPNEKGNENENENENVDPELANLDTNSFVHDAMLDARALASLNTLDYLRQSNSNRVEEEEDAQNLAVQAVNQAVSQAVAAVQAEAEKRLVEHDGHLEADNNHDDPDTADIAAAVAAAEEAVRAGLRNTALSKELKRKVESDAQYQFDMLRKEDEQLKKNGELTNRELTRKKSVDNKNNKPMKRNNKKKDFVDSRHESEDSIENKKIADAINKAHSYVPTQPRGRSFTKEEGMAIDVFIQEYRKIHNMTHEDFLQRIWGNERRKDKFWENIQKVLPDRTRASLYKHVRRTYHVFEKRGVWTKEEEDKLSGLASTMEGQWKFIGSQLNRMPEDCRDRWRNYVKCGAVRNTNKWEVEEERELQKIITTILEEERKRKQEQGIEQGLKESKEGQVTPTINWTKVSEMMGGSRSRIQCRYKWNKIMKRESVKKLRDMDLDTKLWILHSIKELARVDPYIETNLDWNSLALNFPEEQQKHFEFRWNGVDFKTCYQKLKGTVDWKGKSFVEIIDLLIDTMSASSYIDKLNLEDQKAESALKREEIISSERMKNKDQEKTDESNGIIDLEYDDKKKDLNYTAVKATDEFGKLATQTAKMVMEKIAKNTEQALTNNDNSEGKEESIQSISDIKEEVLNK